MFFYVHNQCHFSVPVEKLQNYTSLKLEDLLDGAKIKAWIPAQQLKDEIANCLSLSYGSFSSNEFKVSHSAVVLIRLHSAETIFFTSTGMAL